MQDGPQGLRNPPLMAIAILIVSQKVWTEHILLLLYKTDPV